MIWLTGITGTVLAMVSIACSAILWSSYAVSTLDTVIASATAAALVLCQYLFFINAKHHSGAIKHAHTAAVAVLFITSCAATVGWLESRYQANSRTDLQADSTYTTQQQRLADLTASIQQLRALPATAETHPATEHIQERITSGEAPAMRSFIGNEFNGKKLRHADLTQIFTTLEQRGIIRRQGNRFEPTDQIKQEAA